MDINKRILLLRIIASMDENNDYSQNLGLVNTSRFHGKTLEQITGYTKDLRVE